MLSKISYDDLAKALNLKQKKPKLEIRKVTSIDASYRAKLRLKPTASKNRFIIN